jgi:hypothetical protein
LNFTAWQADASLGAVRIYLDVRSRDLHKETRDERFTVT